VHQVLTTRDIAGFPELMSVMVMLAGTWHGSGHVILFRAAVEWLGMCKKELSSSLAAESSDVEPDVLPPGHSKALLDTTCCLLSYISDVLTALKRVGVADGQTMDFGSVNDADGQTGDTADSDGVDELVQDDDDSAAEDSVMTDCYIYIDIVHMKKVQKKRKVQLTNYMCINYQSTA